MRGREGDWQPPQIYLISNWVRAEVAVRSQGQEALPTAPTALCVVGHTPFVTEWVDSAWIATV